VLSTAEAEARFSGSAHSTFVRLGHRETNQGTTLYLDLGDAAWRAIAITAKGWEVIADPPIKFIRSSQTKPLPTPVRPASDTALGVQLQEDLEAIMPVITDDELTLIIAFLLMCFHPEGPYPGLWVWGGRAPPRVPPPESSNASWILTRAKTRLRRKTSLTLLRAL
jgi:putative DNA primase/helicase